MSKNRVNRNPFLILLCVFIICNIHAVLIVGILYLIIKKPNKLVLAILAGSFVLTLVLYPEYLTGMFSSLVSSIEDLADGGIVDRSSVFKMYLRTLGNYSFYNHVAIFHLSLTMVYAIRELKKKPTPIKTFSDQMKELTPETEEGGFRLRRKSQVVEQNIENETIIGYRNGQPMTLLDNARHVFYAGTTGSGKTVAFANSIESAIKKDYGLLIVDGKGDVGQGSLLDIVNKLKGDRKVYVFNMKNPNQSDKYNPFSGASASAMKDMLVSLTFWSEEHYKSNTELYLQTIIDLFIKCGIPPSFEALSTYIGSKKAEELNDRCIKENLISKEEYYNNHKTFEQCKNIISGASARFLTIAQSDIGKIFDKDGVDIFTALKEKAIVLFILSPMRYQELARAFGKLILLDAIKTADKLDGENLGRIFYMFDEISIYISEPILELVKMSRSLGITCHLATQAFHDLVIKEGDFRERIVENCNNYVIMRQNSDVNAGKWAKIIGTQVGATTTWQTSSNQYTGMGNLTFSREFVFHPDHIKYLPLGEAILVCKDIEESSPIHKKMIQTRIKIRKCF